MKANLFFQANFEIKNIQSFIQITHNLQNLQRYITMSRENVTLPTCNYQIQGNCRSP